MWWRSRGTTSQRIGAIHGQTRAKPSSASLPDTIMLTSNYLAVNGCEQNGSSYGFSAMTSYDIFVLLFSRLPVARSMLGSCRLRAAQKCLSLGQGHQPVEPLRPSSAIVQWTPQMGLLAPGVLQRHSTDCSSSTSYLTGVNAVNADWELVACPRGQGRVAECVASVGVK